MLYEMLIEEMKSNEETRANCWRQKISYFILILHYYIRKFTFTSLALQIAV